MGDFDGDGLLDIGDMAAPSSSPSLEIRLGTGGGRFAAPILTGIGGNPIAAVDLNGDGLSDLILQVGVWLSDGGGAFVGPTATFACFTVGDFNRDGRVDAVVWDSGVAVQYGNGDGTFGPAINGPTNESPNIVFVADMNGDSWPDLFLEETVADSPQVAIWINQQDGGFLVSSPWALPSGTFYIAVSDLNGDGDADLVTFNIFTDSLQTWIQQPDAGLELSTTTMTGPPYASFILRSPSELITPDLNGDGLPDVVMGVFGPSNGLAEALVLMSDRDAGYSVPQTYFGGTTDTAHGPAVFAGDFDNDGKIDLGIMAGHVPATTLARNQGNGAFLVADQISAFPQIAADWDGDGITDLGGSSSAGGTQWAFGLADGGSAAPLLCDGGVDDLVLADVDLDGHLDMLGFVGTSLAIGLNSGRRDVCPVFRQYGTFNTGALVVADFDENGRRGVAIIDGTHNSVVILAGDVDAGFIEEATFTTAFNPSLGFAADIDGDGRAELVLQNVGQPPSIVRRDGGALVEESLPVAPQGYGGPQIAVGDLNGDGIADIVAQDESAGLLVFLNDGHGNFGSGVSYAIPFGISPEAVTLADVEGDGALDLVEYISGYGWILTYRNNGDGSFQSAQLWSPGGNLLVGDFNGDGRLDFLTQPFIGGSLGTLLWNYCQP